MNDKVNTLYPDFSIKPIVSDNDRTQARHIVECNGLEVEIMASKDGLIVTVQHAIGQEVIGEICHDWKGQ